MGSYCMYCQRRCFVYASVEGSIFNNWATCPAGKANDLRSGGMNVDTIRASRKENSDV